jgi:ADP-ribosylglycohydrolase
MAERILGSLKGLATGDAIGKQTEMLSRERMVKWYPNGIRGFEGEPGSVIPRYAGNSKREWRFGETTDDTERTIAVARAILRDGHVCHTSVGRELLTCTKSVHPGVASLWEFHQAGDPARVAQRHDGCGAAIRVTPVGMRYCSDQLEEIVAGARQASIPTHGGPLAIAAAAATAAAVSAAIDGAPPSDMLELAVRASGHDMFAEAVRTIHHGLSRQADWNAPGIAAAWFPDNPLTIVPLALVLGALMHSAVSAILLAANVGGDSDSVASIAGAVLGARCPETINGDWYAVVEAVNEHNLGVLATDLSKLRV